MLAITDQLAIPDEQIDITAIRSRGAGGQNVNKVASAAHLRFDVRASSLPESVKHRVLQIRDRRITANGVIVIKAQEHRTFPKNRAAARLRLVHLIRAAIAPVARRKPTRPTRRSAERRRDNKIRRSRLKRLRGKVAL